MDPCILELQASYEISFFPLPTNVLSCLFVSFGKPLAIWQWYSVDEWRDACCNSELWSFYFHTRTNGRVSLRLWWRADLTIKARVVFLLSPHESWLMTSGHIFCINGWYSWSSLYIEKYPQFFTSYLLIFFFFYHNRTFLYPLHYTILQVKARVVCHVRGL